MLNNANLKKAKFPLFIKFVTIMVTLGVVPLVVVGIRTININKETLRTSVLSLHTEIATSLADKINLYLLEISNEIPYITKIVSAPDIPWEARETVLRTMVDSHPNIVSVSLIDREGKEKTKVFNPSLEKHQKLVNFGGDALFRRFIASNKPSETSKVYYLDKDLNKEYPRLNLFYRLPNNISALIVLNLKPLWDEIASKHFGKSGHAFIIDKSGNVISNPDGAGQRSTEFSGRSPATAGQNISLSKTGIVREAVKSLTVGSAEYMNEDGMEIVGSFAHVKGLNWIVVVQESKKEAYYSSALMQKQAVVIIIFSVILSGGLAFLLARQLTRPILDLIRAAGSIAQKDFSVKVQSRTNDELNDLIETFNEMGSEIKKYDEMQIDRLIAEKTKTEAVIFSIADGIIMTDLSGKILLMNKQARSIFAVNDTALEGGHIWDFVTDNRLTDALKSLVDDFQGSGIRIREIDLSTENTSRFFNAGTKPVLTQKGETIGLVTVIRDITLEKEIDRMKDDFLHSITHDLRNPMTSIRGFLKFLLDGTAGPLNEQQKKMAATMDIASMRLMGMINDILDLAKLEAGRMELQLTDVNLREVSQRILDIMAPQFAKKSITAYVKPPNTTADNVIIKADQRLIERVINNLAGNSVKFTPEKGKIEIGLKDTGNGIEVTVSDNGEGIPPDYLDKIFDKFQQVAGQRKGGTGLGLTICKYIIESHRGKIWVNSEIGKGTTFGFYIPSGLSLSQKGEIVVQKA